MIKIIRYPLFILICFNFSITYSQTVHKNSSLFSDTTYKCTIVTSQKNFYKDVKMYALTDSTVKVLKDDVAEILKIEKISSIKFNKRSFEKGTLIGGAIGVLIGVTLGVSAYGGEAVGYGVILLGIPFALIGGGLGVLFASDQYFDLSNLDFKKKRAKILILVKEFS